MNPIIQWLWSGVGRATVMMLARAGLKIAGTTIVTWLVARHADPGQASDFAGYLSGAALTGLGILLGKKDINSVGGKMAVAASDAFDKGFDAGHIYDGDQRTKIAAVASAMKAADSAAKSDKASILTALKTGTF